MLSEQSITGPHPAALDEEALLARCTVGKGRGSGPGGQHRNKVETLVVVTHGPTGIVGQAGERRSAAENRRVAIRRLRLNLAVHVRAAVPDGDCRSSLWRSRCRDGRIACNPRHADYPALLAEALDVLAAAGLDPKKASTRLECSSSQLIKLIKDHPPALAALNAARAAGRMHQLH